MKYISKAHLILLAVIIIILGGMLLLGEHYANRPIIGSSADNALFPIMAREEPLLSGRGQTQEQIAMMRSGKMMVAPDPAKLSYAQALELYQGSILQFDEDCQLSSMSRSFNSSNEIMVDNRSAKSTSVRIGNLSIYLEAYDFGFITLNQKGPSIPVSCGDQNNVATLIVQ